MKSFCSVMCLWNCNINYFFSLGKRLVAVSATSCSVKTNAITFANNYFLSHFMVHAMPACPPSASLPHPPDFSCNQAHEFHLLSTPNKLPSHTKSLPDYPALSVSRWPAFFPSPCLIPLMTSQLFLQTWFFQSAHSLLVCSVLLFPGLWSCFFAPDHKYCILNQLL